MTGIRRFRGGDGWEIWVGRGARHNDRLTFRMARGNDLWFHARDTAGAHVLLRGTGTPPGEAMHRAAVLAAHFSRLKDAGGGEVLYTPKKYLRRPKGGHPGQVLVRAEKVMHIHLDATETTRLLADRLE